jgi:glycosyltransferase involved in cell wall biosynthesis
VLSSGRGCRRRAAESQVPPPLAPRSEQDVMRTWAAGERPIVSVWCATYNHAPYIESALRGFLGQVTSVPFEVVIRDDASTDGTTDIVRDYAARYPSIIRPIIEKENQWAKKNVFEVMMAASRGDFIALCDGDDYWINPDKLERQTQRLLADPGLTMAAHAAHVINDSGLMPGDKRLKQPGRARLSFDDILEFHWIATASVFFRAAALPTVPAWIKRVQSADIAIELMLATKGDCHYDSRSSAVYRDHGGGITKKEKYSPEEYRLFAVAMYDGIDDFTQGAHRAKIDRHRALVDLVCAVGLLRQRRIGRASAYLRQACRLYPGVIAWALLRRWQRWRQAGAPMHYSGARAVLETPDK